MARSSPPGRVLRSASAVFAIANLDKILEIPHRQNKKNKADALFAVHSRMLSVETAGVNPLFH